MAEGGFDQPDRGWELEKFFGSCCALGRGDDKECDFSGGWKSYYEKIRSGISGAAWIIWRGWNNSGDFGACKAAICGLWCTGIQHCYG